MNERKHGCLFWFVVIVAIFIFGSLALTILAFLLEMIGLLFPVIAACAIIIGTVILIKKIIESSNSTKRPSNYRWHRGK